MENPTKKGTRVNIMGKIPSRKKRQEAVYSLVMFPTIAIILLLIINGYTNLYLHGGILLSGIILGSIASSYTPDMRKKENKDKNIYSGLPQKKNSKKSAQTHKNKTATKTTINPSSNRPLDNLLDVDFTEMNGREFETMVAAYFKAKYKNAIQTPAAKDGGVDIVYTDKDGFKVAVQVKHRQESGNYITANEIYELNGARRNHKCQRSLFISSTGFTPDALQYADSFKMETRSSTWVNGELRKWKEKELKKRRVAN